MKSMKTEEQRAKRREYARVWHKRFAVENTAAALESLAGLEMVFAKIGDKLYARTVWFPTLWVEVGKGVRQPDVLRWDSLKRAKVYFAGKDGHMYPVVNKVGTWDGGAVGLHRLVAAVYCGAPPAGHDVDHIDGDKMNASKENVRYIPHNQNRGAKKGRVHRDNRHLHLTVLDMHLTLGRGTFEIARTLGIDANSVSRLIHPERHQSKRLHKMWRDNYPKEYAARMA